MNYYYQFGIYVRVLLGEESVEGEHFRGGDADATAGIAGAGGVGSAGILQRHLLALLIDAEEGRRRRCRRSAVHHPQHDADLRSSANAISC